MDKANRVHNVKQIQCFTLASGTTAKWCLPSVAFKNCYSFSVSLIATITNGTTILYFTRQQNFYKQLVDCLHKHSYRTQTAQTKFFSR